MQQDILSVSHNATMNDAAPIWDEVLRILADNLGKAAFDSWIKPLRVSRLEDGHVYLIAPSRFVREWVTCHYGDMLRKSFAQVWPEFESYSVDVGKGGAAPSVANQEDVKPPSPRPIVQEVPGDDIKSPINSAYNFDDFITDSSNNIAYTAACNIAQGYSKTGAHVPLFIHGDVGMGKTHLMQAIAGEISRRHHDVNVLYMSAEKFLFYFVKSLQQKQIVSFKEKVRAADVLLIDDVQFICGKKSTQEEFSHTCNSFLDEGKLLVFTASKAPSELHGFDERTRSRIGWGLAARIERAGRDLRCKIAHAKYVQMTAGASDAPLMDDDVFDMLASDDSSIREIEGAIRSLIAHGQMLGISNMSQERARQILHPAGRATQEASLQQIKQYVARHYDIKLQDMNSARRTRTITFPRQVAMYLCKEMTSRSLPDIGAAFGGKNHTTVIHAVRKIEQMMGGSPAVKSEMERHKHSLSRSAEGATQMHR